MATYSYTRSRILQWMGILIALGLIAVSYWYFSARAGTTINKALGDTLSQGLAGYWALDNGSGTSATDSSVNASTGTLTNNPAWTTGQVAGAVDFDGTDDYIDAGDPSTAALDISDSSNFTLSGWFNRDTFTTDDTIMAKSNGQTSADTGYNVYIDDSTDKVTVVAQDGTDQYKIESTTTITATGWYHFALVWNDTTSSETKLYINGAVEAVTTTGTFANVNSLANAVALRMGAESDAGSPFDGKLDEVRLYNRAISSDEVSQLYRLTSPTAVDTGLMAYWSFNAQDMSGNTVYDRSGRPGNTGTAGNTTKVKGKVGQALYFNGTTSSVGISAPSPSLSTPTYATYSAWVYTNGDPGHAQYILRERNGSVYSLYLAATTRNLTFGSVSGTRDSGYAIPINTWTYVALTIDNGTGIFYVDGVKVNQQSFTVSGIGSNAYVTLGSYDDGPTNEFNGNLDEIRIHSRALSPGEIRGLYDAGQSDKTNTSVSQPQGTGRLDSGLVGYWAMDNGSGTSATDSSTNGNTGTLTNSPAWTTGQIGGAVDFDGTDDYVEIGSAIRVNNSDRGALALWAKIDTSASGDRILFSFGGGAIASAGGFRLYQQFSNNKLTFFQGSDSGVGFDTIEGSALSASTWYHIAVVSDGSTYTLYLNGESEAITVASGTNSGDWLADTSVSGTVRSVIGRGYYNGGFSGAFDGQIDEVRLYDRYLSPDEISQLYRLTSPTGVDANLKGYWSFNGADVSGTTAYDRSGAGNTGTLTNSPTKVTGKVGQALSLDGTDDYVTIADASALDITGAISMGVWVKTSDTDSCIMSKTVTSTAKCFESTGNKVYELGVLSSTLYFQTSNGTTANVVSGSATPLIDNQWHHVVGVWDGTTSTNGMKIYLDGVVLYQGTATVSTIQSTSSALTFGGDGGTYDYAGLLDEGRLYNRALSATEIKAQYDAGQSDKTNTSVSQPQGTGRLDSGLTGYWKLDDGTSGATPTSAADSSTNGTTGTLTGGPTWTTGQIGSAVDLDGTDDYVDLGTGTFGIATGSSALTLAAWVSVDTFQSYPCIIGKNQSGTPFGGWQINVNSDTGNRFGGGINVSGSWTSITSTNTYSTGTWYHVAMTYDGATMRLYVNGALDKTTAASGTIQYASTSSSVGIGRNFATEVAQKYLNGRVDEARIYNRTLSSVEVGELYLLASPTGTDTSLKGYWSFNGPDVAGTTAYDRSGSSINGTLTNSPARAIGRIGQGMNFFPSGSDSDTYITMGDPSSGTLDFGSGDFTVAFWMKGNGYSSQGSSVNIPVSKKNSSAPNSAGYSFRYASANQMIFSVGNGTTDVDITAATATTADRQWHHYVGVRSGGTAYFYIDGIVVGSSAVSGSTSNSDIFAVGDDSGAQRNVNATVDEVRVYNVALSTSQITALYNSSR